MTAYLTDEALQSLLQTVEFADACYADLGGEFLVELLSALRELQARRTAKNTRYCYHCWRPRFDDPDPSIHCGPCRSDLYMREAVGNPT